MSDQTGSREYKLSKGYTNYVFILCSSFTSSITSTAWW